MSEQEVNQANNPKAALIGNLVAIGIMFVMAIIFDIEPQKEYGWFGGWYQGFWVPVNWIMSWFNDSILVKAPIHTNAYNVFWWFGLILGAWQWIKIILGSITCIKMMKNNY